MSQKIKPRRQAWPSAPLKKQYSISSFKWGIATWKWRDFKLRVLLQKLLHSLCEWPSGWKIGVVSCPSFVSYHFERKYDVVIRQLLFVLLVVCDLWHHQLLFCHLHSVCPAIFYWFFLTMGWNWFWRRILIFFAALFSEDNFSILL